MGRKRKSGVKVNWFDVFAMLMSVIMPILGEIKKSADPESPDGIKINNDEAKAIAKVASDRIYKEINDRWLTPAKREAEAETPDA